MTSVYYYYIDSNLYKIVFECYADTLYDANELFKEKTGANPLKISAISIWWATYKGGKGALLYPYPGDK
jgi:hypothetical protein